MRDQDDTPAKKGFGLMHAGMAVCCAVMLLPVAGFFVAGGTVAGLMGNLGVFAPIALCIGVHVAMFAFMGKSCHGSEKSEKAKEDLSDIPLSPTSIPATRAQ
jgi:hypothetical protein